MGILNIFSKGKKDVPFSSAASGVAVCDGRHHTWSPWEQYTADMYNPFWRVRFIERRQKRNCVICRFEQDIEVKDD